MFPQLLATQSMLCEAAMRDRPFAKPPRTGHTVFNGVSRGFSRSGVIEDIVQPNFEKLGVGKCQIRFA